MADINIERKKPASIWPWVIGVIAILVIAALILWPDDDSEGDDMIVADTTAQTYQEPADMNTTMASGSLSQPVKEYVEWAQQSNGDGEMGLDHSYTSNGLNKMTAALASIAMQTKDAEKSDFKTKFDHIRSNADMIQKNPTDTEHADKIKRAFQDNVNVLKDLQASSFPDMKSEVENVKKQVDDLDPKTLTLNQKNEVKDVFQRTANLLEKNGPQD